MSIKKLLCKYCSENNDHKTITAGSVIDFVLNTVMLGLMASVALSFTFFITLFVVNREAQTVKEGIISVLTAWGIMIGVGLLVVGIVYLYIKAHEIEITRCERDD